MGEVELICISANKRMILPFIANLNYFKYGVSIFNIYYSLYMNTQKDFVLKFDGKPNNLYNKIFRNKLINLSQCRL